MKDNNTKRYSKASKKVQNYTISRYSRPLFYAQLLGPWCSDPFEFVLGGKCWLRSMKKKRLTLAAKLAGNQVMSLYSSKTVHSAPRSRPVSLHVSPPATPTKVRDRVMDHRRRPEYEANAVAEALVEAATLHEALVASLQEQHAEALADAAILHGSVVASLQEQHQQEIRSLRDLAFPTCAGQQHAPILITTAPKRRRVSLDGLSSASGSEPDSAVTMEPGLSSAAPAHDTTTENTVHQYTVSEAWDLPCCQKKRKLQSSEEFSFVYAGFKCDHCCFHGSMLLALGDSDYIQACKETNRCYETDFIAGFASLVAHHQHSAVIKLVHSQHPCAILVPEECKTIQHGTTKVVSILHASMHYAVMVMNLEEHKLEIFDGLGHPLNKWIDHAINVLKRCSLVGLEEKCRFKRATQNPITYVLKSKSAKWKLVVGPPFYRQLDGFNCGPIACLKVMEVFGSLRTDATKVLSSDLRKLVMDEYEFLIDMVDLQVNKSVVTITIN